MSDELEQRLRDAFRYRAEQVDDVPDMDALMARARRDRASPAPERKRPLALIAVGAITAGSLALVGVSVLQPVPVESPFNPGGALHCTAIQTMTPEEAEAELRERGYEVEWQYQPTPESDISRDRPPATDDTVVAGVVLPDDGVSALVVVERFDPDDPLHRRLRAGVTQCETPDD